MPTPETTTPEKPKREKLPPEPPLPPEEKNRETLRGARGLALSIINHCIETVRLARVNLLPDASSGTRRREALQEIADEVDWLTATDEKPLGFESLCAALRLDAGLIRRQMAAELNTLPGNEMRQFVDRLNG